MPFRHLPVIQNWDCAATGACCRQYEVAITEEERQRIEAQGWDQETDLGGHSPIVGPGWLGGGPRLNQRSSGECVFLNANNRCQIHERFGAEAKPLACRLYPFVLIPVGNHWRVGLRFSCPSVAANQGRSISDHVPDLKDYIRLLERREGREAHTQPAPPLQSRQTLEWQPLFRIVETLLTLLRNRGDRLERRVRKCLALATLCRQTRLEKLNNERLSELLELLCAGLEAEVPVAPSDLPAPSWIGRVLFRQMAAVYVRKDRGVLRGPATQSRLALFRAACRFAWGRGPVPLLNRQMHTTTFAKMEAPTGPLSADAEAMLERYYLVKVESLQFCGPANFGFSFWDGLESLFLTLPAILWLARNFSLSGEGAIPKAVAIVDDHFGYDRALKLRAFFVRTLAQRGELARLIAWYSKG